MLRLKPTGAVRNDLTQGDATRIMQDAAEHPVGRVADADAEIGVGVAERAAPATMTAPGNAPSPR